MKAQITIESLLIAAIGISLLIIAAVAVSKLSSAQYSIHQNSLIKNQLLQIAQSADEICVLGEGNSRTILLSGYGFRIEATANSKGIIAKKNETVAVANLLCPIEILESDFSSHAYLWNENYNVILSSQPPT